MRCRSARATSRSSSRGRRAAAGRTRHARRSDRVQRRRHASVAAAPSPPGRRACAPWRRDRTSAAPGHLLQRVVPRVARRGFERTGRGVDIDARRMNLEPEARRRSRRRSPRRRRVVAQPVVDVQHDDAGPERVRGDAAAPIESAPPLQATPMRSSSRDAEASIASRERAARRSIVTPGRRRTDAVDPPVGFLELVRRRHPLRPAPRGRERFCATAFPHRLRRTLFPRTYCWRFISMPPSASRTRIDRRTLATRRDPLVDLLVRPGARASRSAR